MKFYMCFWLLLIGAIYAQPYGIESRTANEAILIDDIPQKNPGALQLKQVFTSATFSQPVFMTQDHSGRIFVVEKKGRIVYLSPEDNFAKAKVFLDITSQVRSQGEQGLLSMALDPDYANNRKFYVYYSWRQHNPGTSRVSRFTAQQNSASPASEEVIIEIPQPYSNHNGGMIAFGPDNLLYIGLGDGGSGGDPLNSGQDTTTLLGNILRIDVRSAPDKGSKYRIPRNNPFYAKGPSGTLTKKEIYAYGLRNPWRFSFDREMNYLFVGDVGQGKVEEIDVIVPGGNYGWRIMEGDRCFKKPNCNTKGLIKPIASYDRSQGYSVTGGYVYYGSAIPALYGMYVYGDYGSGNIWGLRYDGSKVDGPFELVRNSWVSIASFAQTNNGEVYVIDLSGQIYTFAAQRGNGFPNKLSDIPALLEAGKGVDQTHLGILPYKPVSQLWSDGMHKERFMAIPHLEQVQLNDNAWDFPQKTVLIKNFEVITDEQDPQNNRKRVETRLLYKKGEQWHGFSYEWNEDGSDAQLLTGGKTKEFNIIDANGVPQKIQHLFPSRSQCIQCHTKASGGVLGLRTTQINSEFRYPGSEVVDNQMRTLNHIELFAQNTPPPSKLPQMPDPKDTSASLEQRARSYLATNCAMCHQPNSSAPTALDFRWQTKTQDMKAIDLPPQNGDLGIPDARIIFRGQPQKSILFKRINSRHHETQMPPLGTSRVDEHAAQLIRSWIESMK